MGEQEPGSWTMGEDDFKKLMEGQQKTHQAIEKTSDRVEQIGTELEEQGEAIEAANASISEMDTRMQVSMTEMGSDIKHIKERATEDRQHVDTKETELEGKVGQVHDRLDKTERTTAKHRGEFDSHVSDTNRHSGEAPGGKGIGRTAAIAGGGVAGGGILVVIAKMIIDALAG